MGRAIAAAVFALVLVGVLAVIGWPAARYLHNDFLPFWAGSRALLEGLDPYDPATWLALHERVGSRGLSIVPPRTGYGYPLVTAVVFVPFALLPVALAAPAWIVAQAMLALVATIALGRELFGGKWRRDVPVLIALGASSQPAWVLVEGGNLGGFLLAIAAAAVRLLLDGRPLAAGLVGGLAVVKPHLFLIAVPILLLSLPARTALRLASGAALTGGALTAVSLVLRPTWPAEWLVPLSRLHDAPVGRATVFGLFPPDVRWLGWAVVVAGVALAIVWARRGRPVALVAAVALPVALFLAPYAWSYDHLLLLTTVAMTLACSGALPDGPRARVLALLALVVVALPWVLYVLAFSRGEESWSAVVPLALLAALAVAARTAGRELVRSGRA